MDENLQNVLMKNMAENLPTLRKRLDMNQDELAAMVGVSRSTIANIEKKHQLTWSMFLSLVLVFTKNKETDKLLTAMEIYTEELNDMLKR